MFPSFQPMKSCFLLYVWFWPSMSTFNRDFTIYSAVSATQQAFGYRRDWISTYQIRRLYNFSEA